jgi:hypothetical protein
MSRGQVWQASQGQSVHTEWPLLNLPSSALLYILRTQLPKTRVCSGPPSKSLLRPANIGHQPMSSDCLAIATDESRAPQMAGDLAGKQQGESVGGSILRPPVKARQGRARTGRCRRGWHDGAPSGTRRGQGCLLTASEEVVHATLSLATSTPHGRQTGQMTVPQTVDCPPPHTASAPSVLRRQDRLFHSI